MNIRYMFKEVKIDERTRDYIEKRLQRIEKMLDRILGCQVEISMDKKGFFRVEVMVKAPRKLYRAEETSESIEGSVDIVVDEITNQIRKNKDKNKALKLRGGRSIKKKATVDKNARF